MSSQSNGQVQCWQEQVVIPTYGVGQPDKNPMFLEKRVYQGSSGMIYPHPVIDSVENKKQDKDYNAIFLENHYLKIMLLPELGGRVQMALDKTNQYHFIYFNQVIKPALVGLTGPWISGGIEFNWPQHHRPSTFDPVDYQIQDNSDGSKTVWLNEIERMFRTKGMVGFTLHPNKAYLQLDVQLYNRTDKPQTFLWWANPAVHVNDEYQSVFPPDVHAVMDHGKRDVSDFPIATGTYYKVDYSPGTDISRYKNIPVPTSFMAYHSDFDFIGCYDHGKQAGMIHVANHHIVPGKKQWTWGNGDFGQTWDRQLTDENGPYIELMCGAFTDNQPDFSWLQPGEEKQFRQIFMPYKGIGVAKNASKDVVINLEVLEDRAEIGVYVSMSRWVQIELNHQNQVMFEQTIDLSPEAIFKKVIAFDGVAQDLTLKVVDMEGLELISYTPLPDEKPDIPAPATPAPPPEKIASNDELFHHGLHLEQYRHATYAPEPYYEEALRRDAGDSRCNNAMGLLLLRRGKFAEAEAYFNKAIERITMRNPNPYDSEPYYNLGQSLKMQGHYDEAYDAFYKATWNNAMRASSYFELARIACRKHDISMGLELLNSALDNNPLHHQARHLNVVCLRLSGQTEIANANIQTSLERDPFNFGILYEQSLMTDDDEDFKQLMSDWVHNYIELALDYAHAGFYEDALDILNLAPPGYPMVAYYSAWYHTALGQDEIVKDKLKQAEQLSPDYCFPNRVEAIAVLELAIERNPADGYAPYYLGNFWYAYKQYQEAVTCWQMAIERNPSFAIPFRNLGLAYMNKHNDAKRASDAYERAFELNPEDARVFFELDQLNKKMQVPPSERLQRLNKNKHLVQQRDDLMLEYVTLLNISGQFQLALNTIEGHLFHPWEGGEGKVSEQYVISLIQLARQAIAEAEFREAIAYLNRTKAYPENLNEGKLAGAQENHIDYYLGIAHTGLNQVEEARAFFESAAIGLSEPTSALYYNDQPPEMIFYQGLAHQKLNQLDEAEAIFQKLVSYGQEHLNDEVKMDYFAVSLPNFLVFEDDLTRRNQIHCHYMMELGYIGLGDFTNAEAQFDTLLALDPSHVSVPAHSEFLHSRQD